MTLEYYSDQLLCQLKERWDDNVPFEFSVEFADRMSDELIQGVLQEQFWPSAVTADAIASWKARILQLESESR